MRPRQARRAKKVRNAITVTATCKEAGAIQNTKMDRAGKKQKEHQRFMGRAQQKLTSLMRR
jgi:hypothetical protein